eukprot:6327840-Pyramimonas_sp.AAC.1
MALCWKLSRLLAKNNLGPKQRNFCAPKTRLEMSTWRTFLEQQGSKGGFAARPPAQEEEQARRAARPACTSLTPDTLARANDDFESLRRQLMSA